MKMLRISVLSMMVVLASNLSVAQADGYSDTIEIFKKAPAVQPFFQNAYG